MQQVRRMWYGGCGKEEEARSVERVLNLLAVLVQKYKY
jgi:hypothetical protein